MFHCNFVLLDANSAIVAFLLLFVALLLRFCPLIHAATFFPMRWRCCGNSRAVMSPCRVWKFVAFNWHIQFSSHALSH